MTAGGYSGGRFRAAVLHYALGRGVNALASVALFVLLARALPVRDYAAYVTLWALLELLLAVGNLGTEWVTATEVPRLRQGQAWALLRRLVASALGVQALAFGSLGLLLALAGPQLAHLAGWSLPVEVWPWLGLHLLAEGLGRSLRDQLLSSLLLQGVAQAVQLLRNLVVLLGVAWAMQESAGLGILSIVPLETLASAGGMLLALANLCWHLRHRGAPAGDVAAPDGAVLRRMALHAWVGSLASLLVSPQLLVLLAARFLGSEATALLGFARNLAEQVRRFMPLEFGFAILRTFLVTRFQDRSQLAALVDRSQVAWKLNLALLLPLGLVAALWGDRLATLVGGAKYQAAGPLLVAWLVWVVAWSHHRLSDLWAHLLSRSAAVGRSSLALAALPIFLGGGVGRPAGACRGAVVGRWRMPLCAACGCAGPAGRTGLPLGAIACAELGCGPGAGRRHRLAVARCAMALAAGRRGGAGRDVVLAGDQPRLGTRGPGALAAASCCWRMKKT
jgi:O-antigen/teichoic acid export membrane protein